MITVIDQSRSEPRRATTGNQASVPTSVRVVRVGLIDVQPANKLGVPGRYAASGAAPVTPDEAWLPVPGAVGLPAEARLAAHALCQLS